MGNKDWTGCGLWHSEHSTAAHPAADADVERVARALLAHRGFGFYTDPMEGGQDAYDITLEALEEARAAIAALRAAPACAECKGTGRLALLVDYGLSDWGVEKCPTCKGTGRSPSPAGEVYNAWSGQWQNYADKPSPVGEIERAIGPTDLMGSPEAIDTYAATIERATIERCAKVADSRADAYENTRAPGWHEVVHEARTLADAIRAISNPPEQEG